MTENSDDRVATDPPTTFPGGIITLTESVLLHGVLFLDQNGVIVGLLEFEEICGPVRFVPRYTVYPLDEDTYKIV